MKRIKSWALMLSGIAILSFSMQSCDDEPGTSITDNGIPKDFNYLTVRTIDVQVNVNDLFSGQYLYKVEVFDQNPLTTDTVVNLLAAGVANQTKGYSTRVVIPQYVTTLFVRQTDPTKKSLVKAVSVEQLGAGVIAKCDFRPVVSNSVVKQKAAPVYTDKASDYPLPTTGVTTITSGITLNGLKYYVASGTTITNLNLGSKINSELYVAGNVTIHNNSTTIPASTKIVVLSGGKVTFSKTETMSIEAAGIIVAVHEGGTVEFDKSVQIGKGAKLINDGIVTAGRQINILQTSVIVNNNEMSAENLYLTNSGVIVNNDNLNIEKTTKLDSNSSFINNGTFESKESFELTNNTVVVHNNNVFKTEFLKINGSNGVFTNNCRIECGYFQSEGMIVNNGEGALILCQDMTVNNTTFNLTGASMVKSIDMGLNLNKHKTGTKADGMLFVNNNIINGTMVGAALPLFICRKIENKDKGWQVLNLSGNFEFTVTSGSIPPSTYFKLISSGVSISTTPVSVIPSTACNLGGVNSSNGGGSGDDDDDDDDNGGGTGGGDDDDDDDNGGGTPPTDPTFPLEVVEGTDYVYSMEDLWPHMGDYDMNDFVFKIHAITKYVNSSNKVEKMTFLLTPLASGSTKMVSAALQLDGVAEGAISVVSTQDIARIDQGHSQANVILFENVHALFGLSGHDIVNTFNNVPMVTTTSYTFEITFTTPVDQSAVSVDKLNFYSIVGEVNSNDRHEIHLAGYQPSSKVLKTSVSYKDENNMVWALMLPTSTYLYPAENVKIFNAYPKFNDWAKSGGKEFTDWYLNPSDSTGLIYKRQEK